MASATPRAPQTARATGWAASRLYALAVGAFKAQSATATQRITVPIDDLGCGGGGVLTVELARARLLGVARVYVNPATEMAYIQYDPSVTSPERCIAAISRTGFRAGQPSAR